MADIGSETQWICARCEVTASWMPGHKRSRPAAWIEDAGSVYCLACRRDLAAEAGLSGAPDNVTTQRRAQLRAGALVDFEVRRDPHRSNGEIARAIRCSVPAVQKARARIR